MEFKIIFRQVTTNDLCNTWHPFFEEKTKTFDSLELAIKSVEEVFGSWMPNPKLVFNEKYDVYAIKNIQMQFRFLVEESPWKVGLTYEG